MRPSDRIPRVLGLLEKVWAKTPDMRLGQMLVWASASIRHTSDPFYLEDDVLEQFLKEEAAK